MAPWFHGAIFFGWTLVFSSIKAEGFLKKTARFLSYRAPSLCHPVEKRDLTGGQTP
jgi:hypothetical protein